MYLGGTRVLVVVSDLEVDTDLGSELVNNRMGASAHGACH